MLKFSVKERRSSGNFISAVLSVKVTVSMNILHVFLLSCEDTEDEKNLLHHYNLTAFQRYVSIVQYLCLIKNTVCKKLFNIQDFHLLSPQGHGC